jgi:hypothetical protein
MLALTRPASTLVGAAAAGFLIWLAAQMDGTTQGGYWATYGLLAAAGLAMALSQIIGGWTKWGWPRLSAGMFLGAFLPVAIVGLWLLLARQPGDTIVNTGDWSSDIGIGGVVSDLGDMLAVVAFGIGLTFGFVFDTTGPRRRAPGGPVPADTAYDRTVADEPVTAERREVAEREEEPVESDERPVSRT